MVASLLQLAIEEYVKSYSQGNQPELTNILDVKVSNEIMKYIGEIPIEYNSRSLMMRLKADFFKLTIARHFSQLPDCLHPRCKQQLRHLHIYETMKLSFEKHWLSQIKDDYPSLETFSFTFSGKRRFSFRKIHDCFKNLKQLKLCNIRLNNLSGIIDFERLEVLDLTNCDVLLSKSYAEIPQMRSLQVLNISMKRRETDAGSIFAGNIYAADVYAQNISNENTTINFIDCSGSASSGASIMKILDTHKNLRTISLLRCDNIDVDDIKSTYPNVNILTDKTLKDCCDALIFYKSSDMPYSVQHIIKAMQTLRRSFFRPVSNELFFDSVYLLREIVEKHNRLDVDCIMGLENLNLQYGDDSTLQCRKLIIDVMLNIVTNYGREPEKTDIMFRMLRCESFFEVPEDYIQKIWLVLTDILDRQRGYTDPIYVELRKTVTKASRMMTLKQLRVFVENDYTVRMIRLARRKPTAEFCLEDAIYSCDLYHQMETKPIKSTVIMMVKLLKFVEFCTGENGQEQQIEILKLLEKIVILQNKKFVYKMFTANSCGQLFLKLLETESAFVKHGVMSLYMALFYASTKKIEWLPSEDVAEHKAQLKNFKRNNTIFFKNGYFEIFEQLKDYPNTFLKNSWVLLFLKFEIFLNEQTERREKRLSKRKRHIVN